MTGPLPRRGLAQQLQTAWFEQNLAVFLWPLLPLAGLFGAVSALRRLAYRRGWLRHERLPVPVVVVGNLIVGGAGKTPLTLHLVEALRRAGKHPGIISRGYGGQGEVLGVGPASDPRRVGDEPVLLAARSGVPVFVGRRRAEAGRALLAAHPEVDVLVCDDGLQHYALARDVEIVVGDRRGLGNGRLLPAGPLREPRSRLDSVDALVVHSGGAALRPDAFTMELQPGDFYALQDPTCQATPADWAGRRLHAMAGIGHPERFFATLRAMGLAFAEHPFPDHHAYVADDFSFVGDGVLLMTEKDAVKCRPFYRGEAWVLPVTAHVSPALMALVLEKIDGRQTA
jgi:tetraacyldisaccharide 4'-kinase